MIPDGVVSGSRCSCFIEAMICVKYDSWMSGCPCSPESLQECCRIGLNLLNTCAASSAYCKLKQLKCQLDAFFPCEIHGN